MTTRRWQSSSSLRAISRSTIIGAGESLLDCRALNSNHKIALQCSKGDLFLGYLNPLSKQSRLSNITKDMGIVDLRY